MTSVSKGVKIDNHLHELLYMNYKDKKKEYQSGFICNFCKKSYNYEINCFHCKICEFDVCDSCFCQEIEKGVKKLNLY